MYRVILAVVIAVVFSTQAAFAVHNEPKIAKTVKVSVVTAYEPCTTPTLITSTGSNPACPAVRSDPVCGFGGGHGLMYVRTKGATGWAVKIVLLGLEDNCKGETIHFYASLRSTSDDCGGAACTVDFPNVDLGSCTVSHTGFCGLSTPVFANPPLITKPSGVEMTDLKGVRSTGLGAPATSFRYGIVTSFY